MHIRKEKLKELKTIINKAQNNLIKGEGSKAWQSLLEANTKLIKILGEEKKKTKVWYMKKEKGEGVDDGIVDAERQFGV